MNSDRHIDELTIKVAGARGGAATYARHGKRHFQAIGRKGQASLAAKITSEQRQVWGSMGGRPRRAKYQHGGERR